MKTLTPKQSIAIKNKARYKVLNFGRRAGKTTELAYEALLAAFKKENAKVTYYAQTFGDARDIAWDIFLNVFGESVYKKNETLLEITVARPEGGFSKITLRGWESVVTSEKGRGTENDLLLLDEVAFCRGFKHYYETVLEPTLLTTRGRVVFSSTPNGFNEFYELANVAQQNPKWFYVHATSYDNPYNDEDWLEERKKTLPEDVFAQEYLADFRKQEGLVFKEFNRALHTYDKMQTESISYIAGVDFGFTNPTGILMVKKDKRGTYWIEDEYYQTQKTDAQVAEIVAAYEFDKVYPDPENAAGIQELRDKNVNVYDVVKGKDSIKKGIHKMRELFKQRRLRINKNCVNLIWELETYHYPKRRPIGDEEELPEHENCHLIDAIRYIILMDCEIVEVKQYEQWLVGRVGTRKAKVNPAR